MNEKHTYIIDVEQLFKALNNKRTYHGLSVIDNPLIASKLGILFALKTNGYVNFKGQSVQLNDSQLIALQELLEQHFNAEMTVELRQLVVTEEQFLKDAAVQLAQLTSTVTTKIGIFSKFKGLFKTKIQQESHA